MDALPQMLFFVAWLSRAHTTGHVNSLFAIVKLSPSAFGVMMWSAVLLAHFVCHDVVSLCLSVLHLVRSGLLLPC